MTLADDRFFAKHFPSPAARAAADRAIDALPVTETMARFLDTWIGAYVAAGGRTKLVLG